MNPRPKLRDTQAGSAVTGRIIVLAMLVMFGCGVAIIQREAPVDLVESHRSGARVSPSASKSTALHQSFSARRQRSHVLATTSGEDSPASDGNSHPSEELDAYGDLAQRYHKPELPAGLRELIQGGNSAAIQAKFRDWGREGGEKAADFALVELSGQMRLEAAAEAIRGWAERDSVAAAGYVARLLTPQHDYIVYAMAQDYSLRDGAAAVAWSLREVPAEFRNTATQHAIMGWLRQDPQAAVEWVSAYASERTRLSRAERTMVSEAVFYLAGNDPAAAQKFVGRLPVGGAYEAGASALMDRWWDSDPDGAREWLLQAARQGNTGSLDGTLAVAAERAAESQPADGLAWVELIQHEDLKEDIRRRIELRIEAVRSGRLSEFKNARQ